MSSPPTYDEATKSPSALLSPNPGTSGGPPAYDQLFGISDLKEAKRDSPNQATFAMKFFEIVCGSIACALCTVILSALPITMIVIGSVYLDDCEDRRMIPIWLIVFGVVSVVQSIIDIGKRCFGKKKKDSEGEDSEGGRDTGKYANRSGGCLESLLSIFLFVWIILGSVWVFGYWSTFQDCRDDRDTQPCCHPVPYLFSFVVLVLIYVISFLVCCCCCFCLACVAAIFGAAAGAE